jgi:hypothetical protein
MGLSILSVVLTSAAVGALVSSLFTFVSQLLERRARRKELLMKTAADLATKALDAWIDHAKTSGRNVQIPPLSFFTYYFHRQLSSLLQESKLTPEEQTRYEDEEKRFYSSQVAGEEP